jgi:hypothetical protein
MRRPLTGKPLLVGSAGLLLGVGCGGKPVRDPPVGNLMAPVTQSCEVCVDVTPPEAVVTVAGTTATARCTTVEVPPGSQFPVSVAAPGFATQDLQVACAPDPPVLSINLEPEFPPVGNLMPPQ